MGRAMGRSHEEEGEWILRYGETGEAVLSKHLLRGVTRDGAGEVRQHRLWKASQSSQTLSSIETWKTSILFIIMSDTYQGKRRRGWQRMRWLDSNTNSVDTNLSKLREIVEDREAWHAAVHGVTKNWTRLGD